MKHLGFALAISLFLFGSDDAHALCPAAPTGSTSDTAIMMMASGSVAGIGPVSRVSSTNEGAFVYDSTNDLLKYCDGTSWVSLSSSGGATVAGSTGDIQFNDSGALAADTGQLYWDATNNRLGIGTSTPAAALHVSASTITMGGTGTSSIELGQFSNGNQFSYIDFIGDDTYTDYGLRIIRNNGGPNTSSDIVARGTGGLYLTTVDVAPIVLRTSNTERMRVATNGNIGIGTTAPARPLHVSATGTNYLRLEGTAAADQGLEIIGDGAAKAYFARRGDNRVGIYAGDGTTEDVTILDGGNVGIGTTSPAQELDVYGDINLSGPTSRTVSFGQVGVAAPGAGSNGLKLQLYGPTPGTMAASDYALGIENNNMWFNTSSGFKWYRNSVVKMVLDASDNLGIGTSAPTARLDVSGSIISRAFNEGSATSIDFSQANVAYTSAACGAFTLSNMADGGTYTLIATGSGSGPATFTHTGLTIKTTGTLTCTSAKHTVFSFVRAGSNVYVTMITGY